MRKSPAWVNLTLTLICAVSLRVSEASASLPNIPAYKAYTSVSLNKTLTPSALHDTAAGNVSIIGSVASDSVKNVQVRVTTSQGISTRFAATVNQGDFCCEYPRDFNRAPTLKPGALFIDATDDSQFDTSQPGHTQAEATVLVYDNQTGARLEMPSILTNDLLDHNGGADRHSRQWPVVRVLVNLYMHSEAAHLIHFNQTEFDLDKPADLKWFKSSLTFYDFSDRDRNWSKPLRNRATRTFWQSMWNTWFNASNDHPLDGNPENRAWTNYLPYAFANDFADLLVMNLLHDETMPWVNEHQKEICREATRNLLAMQYREPGNFALPDAQGKHEIYTAGAFRYGMFKDGEFLTEGKGWFYNPDFHDYAAGGVLNGRAVWGLGEALRWESHGPLAPQLKASIVLALKFCLHDGAAGGYVHKTAQGNLYWRDAGEHAYWLLGMLAACHAAPDLPIAFESNAPPVRLDEVCIRALNALVDLKQPSNQWSIYPNEDAMAITALAEGARLMPRVPAADRWRKAAIQVADAWMQAKVDPNEWSGPVIHFGLRRMPNRMTYVWKQGGNPSVFYYQTGLWIQALAEMYAVTGSAHYYDRAEAMVSYLCGNNPWHVRLFNELGGVYNWTEDTNHDGMPDELRQDIYPESTAFCQIGIIRLIQAHIFCDQMTANSKINRDN